MAAACPPHPPPLHANTRHSPKKFSSLTAAGVLAADAWRLLQVDTMIVQAIGLLDDLDKELNTYAMRVREWYGWHFPEMTKIVADNIKYAKAVSFLPPLQAAVQARIRLCMCVSFKILMH